MAWKKATLFFLIAAFVGLPVASVQAVSDRLIGQTAGGVDFDAFDYGRVPLPSPPASADQKGLELSSAGWTHNISGFGRTYSGGLDVDYALVASGVDPGDTRVYVRVEENDDTTAYSEGAVRVAVYDYLGGLRAYSDDNYDYDNSACLYSGTAKVNPDGDTIWYSYTGSSASSGEFKSVSWAPNTLTIGAPSPGYSLPGAFELEFQPTTNTMFFAGKATNAWTDPHSIFVRQGGGWYEVATAGDYSVGFAFDSDGNLWTGSCSSYGPTAQEYIYMWTAAQVSNRLGGGALLDTSNYTERIACPPPPTEDYTAANDFEAAATGGIVYVTLNWCDPAYVAPGEGYVARIAPDGMGGYDLDILAETNPNYTCDASYQTQKALSFDGVTKLADGGHYDPTLGITGNRLFVDQDYKWGEADVEPDQVTAVTVATDSDSDGVPDPVDNAYLTYQSSTQDQIDGDCDMYANVVDGDFNNNQLVDFWYDWYYLDAAYGTADPIADMDCDGDVDVYDELLWWYYYLYDDDPPWF